MGPRGTVPYFIRKWAYYSIDGAETTGWIQQPELLLSCQPRTGTHFQTRQAAYGKQGVITGRDLQAQQNSSSCQTLLIASICMANMFSIKTWSGPEKVSTETIFCFQSRTFPHDSARCLILRIGNTTQLLGKGYLSNAVM